jgi:AcrR family transcriptional regulator
MGQFKKTEVYDAILRSAKALFSENGYVQTSLPRIAAGAGISTANVYVYFKSKVEILYAIYDPWLRARLAQLAAEAQDIEDPLERLKHVLRSFWRDIPREDGGFANNIIQAISSLGNEQGYRPTLLRWMKAQMQVMVLDCLPPAHRAMFEGTQLGHFLVMAFDGFIVYHHIKPRRPLDERTLDALCRTLLALPGPVQPKSATVPQRLSTKNSTKNSTKKTAPPARKR